MTASPSPSLLCFVRPGAPVRVDHVLGSVVFEASGRPDSGPGTVRLRVTTYGVGVAFAGLARDAEDLDLPVGVPAPVAMPRPGRRGPDLLALTPISGGEWGVKVALSGPRSFVIVRPPVRRAKAKGDRRESA